jgi:hypothetical protein
VVAGYGMTCRKLNEYIKEEIGITNITAMISNVKVTVSIFRKNA